MLLRSGGGFAGRRQGGRKRKGSLRIGGSGAASPGAIVLEPARYFTPPFRLDGQVAFGLSGNAAQKRGAPCGSAQRRVAKTANFGRFVVVDGAAMLTGFYHRSVLRCGRLAERRSGVLHILSAARPHGKNCVELSRIRHPRQPGGHPSQSIASGKRTSPIHRRCKPLGGMLG